MKKIKTVFIGGGFLNQQYPWLIPIIDKYCKNKKINQIIFETLPSKDILENKYYNKIFKSYKILKLEEALPFFLKIKLVRFFLVVPIAFFYSFFIKRQKILENTNWTKSQFRHAVWDTAANISKHPKEIINPGFKIKFYSSIKNFETKLVAKYLIEKNLSAVFLNHCVYFYRTLLSEFRKEKKIKTYIQANYTVFRQNEFRDNNENILSKSNLIKLKKVISNKNIDNYWKKRINGNAVYSLANDASNLKKISKLKVPNNVLMLHIFKDSPYSIIDKNRIFKDYVDWLKFTLNVISKSDEVWGIKFHPSAHRWGENSHKIFNEFISEMFQSKIPKNFFLINKEFSNYKIFKKSKRIVTFWGTCHLESAAFGLKPIIIRDVQLSAFDKSSVIKPKNLNEYKSKLLTKNLNEFKLTKTQMNNARFLIFIREKVLNFINDIDQHWIMRGDSQKHINKNFLKTIKNIKKYENFLKQNATLLTSNFSHTLSKKYIKYFLN